MSRKMGKMIRDSLVNKTFYMFNGRKIKVLRFDGMLVHYGSVDKGFNEIGIRLRPILGKARVETFLNLIESKVSDSTVTKVPDSIIKTPDIPIIKDKSKIPNTPPIDVKPQVVSLSSKNPVIPTIDPITGIKNAFKEQVSESWLQKLIKTIKMWIKKILTL